MSDPNFPDTTHANDEPWTDALVDSLLRETAEGADEAFLASVENLIDAESEEEQKFVSIPVPNSRNSWIWRSGVAAVLVIGLVSVLTKIRTAEKQPDPPQMIQFAQLSNSEAPAVDRVDLRTSTVPSESSVDFDRYGEARNRTGLAAISSASDLPEKIEFENSLYGELHDFSAGTKSNFRFDQLLTNIGPIDFARTSDAIVKDLGYESPAATAPLDALEEESKSPAINLVSKAYEIQLQESVKKAHEYALRGSKLMAESDYQGAIDQYRAALDILRASPLTEPRHAAYVKQFSRACTILATQRADEGRYPESIALIEEVLQPSVAPDNIDAKRLLEHLGDPAHYSLTSSHLERVRKVKLALKASQGYVNLGDFDRADREFHKAINEDPYNTAARRMGEEGVRYRMNYYDAAYDHTRAKILSEIAAGWESPVPSGQIDGLSIVTAQQPSEPAEAGQDGIRDLGAEQRQGTVRIGGGYQGSHGSNASLLPLSPGTDTLERSRDEIFAVIGHGGTSFVTEIEPTGGTGSFVVDEVITLGQDNSSLVTLAQPNVGKPTESNVHSIAQTESLVTELAVVGRGFKPTTRPAYGPLVDNPWFSPRDEPLSTFSIDVDTASWTNLRAMIRSGRSADAIPNDAVRIEELINYFEWDYPKPDGEHPFAFATETAECPWNKDHRLMRVGIQGREIPKTERPDANLVFLLDVSGSMNQPEKLPLVKRSISVLVEELKENDTVSIVVYAGAEGLALRPTSGRDQITIQDALDKLDAGGSTNGGAGIKLAYKMAREQFVENGINRVILCTDGDFNVGTTGTEELVSLVETEAKSGVFLSVCGFGQDNLNDAMLEEITNKGNGNYSYIDDFREARKVFLQDLMGTLVTIAKDVKIQVEFNPSEVAGYRLIGYANRKLEAEDFENDEIDAGEVGSGHAVTALYEIVPAGAKDNPADDEIGLRYQKSERPAPERELIPSGELALLKLRYKKPDGDQSILMEQPVMPGGKNWKRASDDFRFASAVGLFGMILREHESVGDATFADVIEIASKAKGADPQGWKAEFVDLVKQLADR